MFENIIKMSHDCAIMAHQYSFKTNYYSLFLTRIQPVYFIGVFSLLDSFQLIWYQYVPVPNFLSKCFPSHL